MLQYFPNITGSLQVTGSVSVSGSITATGGIIVSGSIASASYSSNSELLDNLDSTAFVFTSSFNTYSSSMSSRVGNIEGNYATTGSNIFMGAQTVCANITSTGTIIAQTLNVQQVTSSIVYSSGSNIFGCLPSDVQQMTGSLRVTGSGASYFLGGNVGIGTNAPPTYQNYRYLSIAGNSTTQGGVVYLTTSDNSYRAEMYVDNTGLGISSISSGLPMMFSVAGSERMRITSTGIACFACQVCVASLALSGDINNTNASVFDINSAPSVASVLRLQRSGGTGGIEIYQGNTTTRNILIANTGELCLGTSICSPRGTFSCCLGVGIAIPGYTLDVVCNGTTTNCLANVLKISHVTSATAASGLGAGILFTVQRPSSNLNINRAAIYGISGTDADDDGDLAFYTLSNTGATGFNQKMRITSDGYVAVTGNQANVCVPYLQGMLLGWNRSNGQGESMINWTDQGGGTNPSLTFNYRFSTGLCERMRIDCSGNVGIGTSAPIAGLDVRASNSNISAYFLNSGADFKIVNATGLTSIGTSTTNPIAILTSDTERMRITSAGCVSIGTACSISTLTIKSVNDGGIVITRPGDGTVSHLRISTTETGGDAYTVKYNTFNNEMIFNTYSGGGTGGNIIFRTTSTGGAGGESERLRINCHGIATFACQVCVTNGLVIAAGSGLTINGSGAHNITSRKLMFSNWNVGDTKAIKLLNISLGVNTRIIGDLTIYKGARTSNHGFVGKAFIWASSAGSYSASAVCLFNPTATFNSGDSYLGNIWWCTQSADLYYCIVTEANYEFLGFEINIVGSDSPTITYSF